MLKHSKCAVIPCQATSESGISNLEGKRTRMMLRLFSVAGVRTLGPQIGMSPLHRVLAFWSMALSHSSLPLASLQRERGR